MTDQQRPVSTYTGMNVLVLEGNLTRNPEAKEVQVGEETRKVLSGRLAYNTRARGGTKPNYIQFEIWGQKRVDGIMPLLRKGSSVVVHGELILDEVPLNGDPEKTRTIPKIRVEKIKPPRNGTPSQSADAPAESSTDAPAKDPENIPF